jgi:hypothetical protein
MATRPRRRPEEDEERPGQAQTPEEAAPTEREEEEPVPAEAVESLRAADPQTRAAALMRLQRTRGNATVQRLVRSLQTTDAGRDARIQSIGDRAEEPAASGRLDKAVLYRESIETELEKGAAPGKTERELVQDLVNTVGQIFVNYQAALHMFEKEVREGQAEAVPVELGKAILSEFTSRDLFGPLADVVGDIVPGLQKRTLQGGEEDVDNVPEEEKGYKESAPALAMRNLVIAERRRIALQQGLLIKDQMGMLRASEDEIVSLGPAKRDEFRGEVAATRGVVDALEGNELTPEQIFKKLMDRWRNAARNSGVVTVTLDHEWQVRRAHLSTARGSRLAAELMKAQGSFFDLNALKIPRVITWEPEALATCEALIDERGTVRDLRSNDSGAPFLEEMRQRLQAGGLPRTRIMSGD